MAHETYLELNRHFYVVPREFKYSEDISDRLAWGISAPLRWSDLEKEYRVVVLAEAGAGKTIEIQQATKRIKGLNKQAFFIRLEYLIDNIEDAFDTNDTGTFDEFEAWLSSEEEAWIFLDSVDESRLGDPRDFEKAIRKISRKLGSAGQRAHIYVTSRISEWRPQSDLAIINSQLPYRTPNKEKPNEESHHGLSFEEDLIKSVDLEGMNDSDNSETGAKIIALAPLDSHQIRAFVEQSDVPDTDRFFHEIERQDVTGYLSRPQDLAELIDFWKDNQRIGSRYELLRTDVEKKLKEDDPNRSVMKPLNLGKTLEGARRIAAAVTFQKLSRIKVPDRHNEAEGVDAATVLDDWQPTEISALLERPIFDQAIYGTVRFHHRSLREFLTADWLLELVREGKSRREIEGVLFRIQYGLEVVIPTARPLLPWLALTDQPIRDRLLRIAPEILFEGGDPSRLPKDLRVQILMEICTRIDTEEAYRSALDYGAIRRFATPDLDDVVLSLLEKYRGTQELHTLLLGLVWHARLPSCRDIAAKIAGDPKANKYSRVAAIRALSAVGTDQQIASLIESFAREIPVASRRVISELIDSFAPVHLEIKTLIELLSKIPDPQEHGYSGIEQRLLELVARLDENHLLGLLGGLRHLFNNPPFVERRQLELSQKYSWLLNFAVKAAERLVSLKSQFALNEDCLAIISFSSLAGNWLNNSRTETELRELVPTWTELNRALFWYDVADARRLLDKKKGEALTDWWQVRIFRDYWRFEDPDFEYVATQIVEQPMFDDKMIALTLAFQIYKENGRIRRRREQLQELVSGNNRLSERLSELLHPQKMSETEAKWKAQEAGYKKRQREREGKKHERYVGWKDWLLKNTKVLRDISIAPEGKVWTAQDYLLQRMRKFAPERNRWTYSNWRDLESDYGADVAAAFRDGLVSYWRAYKPKLRSEGIEKPNSVPHAVVLGLCGLEIESEETKDWPKGLSDEEAKLAIRYALWEMNGFPKWLRKLNANFPNVVCDIFIREISWECQELEGESEPHYLLSDLTWHGDNLDNNVAPKLLKLLEANFPKHIGTLEKCLTVLLRNECIEDSSLSALAQLQLKKELPNDQKAIWCAVFVSVDPAMGIDVLRKALSQISNEPNRQEFCMQFAVHLLGDRRQSMGARENYKSVEHLKDLFFILHKHIRLEDDIDRSGKGVYSPGLRDGAQNARNTVFNILKEIPGKETYLALREIADKYPDKGSRAWMNRHAVDRAVLDADLPEWSPEDIRDFARDAETKPSTHRQLFDLAVSRLYDLKNDLENGDTSVANLLKKADGETELRNYIGGWLRDRAKEKYSIPQEDELADAKRPDLRFLGHEFDGPVPTEFKIADRWTGSALLERLENQLCNDYLRDVRSRMGIFLLMHDGTKQHWEHPDTKIRMTFSALRHALQEQARNVIADRADIEAVAVIGIDLTKRSTPKRKQLDRA